MTRHQLGIAIGKEWRDLGEKLARDIIGRRRGVAKRGIVFVKKLVVELIVDHFSSAFFDFTDVDEHSRNRIHPTTEDKIGDLIATGSVARAGFWTERREVFAVGPARDKQPTRG